MHKSRITLSLDKEWSFHLGDIEKNSGSGHGDIYNTSKAGSCQGVPQGDFNASGWEVVDLPHDWSVALPFDKDGSPAWGYKPKGKAWYRKVFSLSDDYAGKQITIDFDGITKNSVIYFNGSVLKRSFSGYVPFSVDITDRALLGGAPNVLAVFVDADDWEGWWYEGAGIYRHVRLNIKNKVNIDKYGVFIKTAKLSDNDWNVQIETLINNGFYNREVVELETRIFKAGDPDGEAARVRIDMTVDACSSRGFMQNVTVSSPDVWDVDSPNLYRAVSVVYLNGEQVDECETLFGFRTIRFDADKGFFLNGRHLKLFGTCNHQDHGGLGVAVYESINEYRIKKLKEMGSNAYRCAHGMTDSSVLDACDRLGMLVMDENRAFETSEQCLEDLRTMVKRDRNHPSVIMYSIFNEEPLQSSSEGRRMAEHMRYEIRRLDDTRYVTGAMHGGILESGGAAGVLDVCGINYQSASYDEFHEKYPDIPVVASETTSAFSVRGCYKTDYEKNQIACYDEEASDWGNTVRETWREVLPRDYISGAFMWTGFDYLGEPTPFAWPSVSSFFGLMDICGFEKDSYYLSKAIFSKSPVCHVLPHWSFRVKEGTIIKVMSCTNCEEAELFVNGKSKGKKKIDPVCQAVWNVPFEPGELKLVGYNGTKVAAVDIKNTSGSMSDILIKPDRDYIYSDGDALVVNIYAVDENGENVPDENSLVKFSASGGKVLGMSNGDPNSHEDFCADKRSFFNGKCQAIVSADTGSEYLTLTAETDKISFEYKIKVIEKKGLPAVKSVKEIYVSDWRMSSELSPERPSLNDTLLLSDMNSFEPVIIGEGAQSKFDNKEGMFALYRAKVNIPDEINSKAPSLRFNGLWGVCGVYIDGRLMAQCDHEWPAPLDVPLDGFKGVKEIKVIIQSRNFGAGISSSVVIR